MSNLTNLNLLTKTRILAVVLIILYFYNLLYFFNGFCPDVNPSQDIGIGFIIFFYGNRDRFKTKTLFSDINIYIYNLL